MGENPGWPRIVLCMIWAVLLMPFSHGHDGRSQQWRWRKQSKQALIPDKETSMRTDEAMAVEDLHADLMAEIARLRAVREEIRMKCLYGESHTWIDSIARKALASEQK